MGLHIGAVDRDRAAEMSGFGQRREHLLPDLAMGPAIEAVVDRRPRAVFRRTVTPATPGPQNMENTAQDPTVIDPAGSWLISWQKRLNQRPGFVA